MMACVKTTYQIHTFLDSTRSVFLYFDLLPAGSSGTWSGTSTTTWKRVRIKSLITGKNHDRTPNSYPPFLGNATTSQGANDKTSRSIEQRLKEAYNQEEVTNFLVGAIVATIVTVLVENDLIIRLLNSCSRRSLYSWSSWFWGRDSPSSFSCSRRRGRPFTQCPCWYSNLSGLVQFSQS